MASHEDVAELVRLSEITTRPFVTKLLLQEAERLKPNTDVSGTTADDSLAEPTSASKSDSSTAVANPCIAVTRSAPQRYYKDITTYAWDQSEKFMKVYVTLNGVQKLSKENVTSEFTAKSFNIKIENLEGSNYTCRIVGLWGNILPEKCYHRVKSDMVLIMLKKAEDAKTWPYVTEREDKTRTTPKFDEKKDPNEGLMDMLKKMYEDGDDEMKRTIAKSWCESQNKKSPVDS